MEPKGHKEHQAVLLQTYPAVLRAGNRCRIPHIAVTGIFVTFVVNKNLQKGLAAW